MTSGDAKVIRMGGVGVLSDMCLYDSSSDSSSVRIISIYGSPQQVRAVLSGFVSHKWINVEGEGGEITLGWNERCKFRTVSIGYGKAHGLLTSGDPGSSWIGWLSPAQKTAVLNRALSRRKIPFLPEWVLKIERELVTEGYLVELAGWGIRGYDCHWDDDNICNLISERILPHFRRGGKDGAQKVS